MSSTLENDILSEGKSKGKRCKQRVNILFYPRRCCCSVLNEWSKNVREQSRCLSFVYWFYFVLQSMWGNSKKKIWLSKESMGKQSGKSQEKRLCFRSNKQKKRNWRVCRCLLLKFRFPLRIDAKLHWVLSVDMLRVKKHYSKPLIKSCENKTRACGLTSHWTLLNDSELNCRWTSSLKHELIII